MKKSNAKAVDVEIIDLEEFNVLHVLSKPPRIEAQVVFDRDNISQKLLFTIMEITHSHGFGCSPPHFNDPNDPTMTFYVGTIMPSTRSIKKYLNKIYFCLEDIKEFAENFNKQLDFSVLDLSMFAEFDIQEFYPEKLASIRDQNFGGSWEALRKTLLSSGRKLEADFVKKCQVFEKVNKKDIGLVGHKLSDTIEMLIENEIESEQN